MKNKNNELKELIDILSKEGYLILSVKKTERCLYAEGETRNEYKLKIAGPVLR